jgi:ribonuclease E
VNSARSTKGKDIEETAFKTNLEAATEIARQLRLRDVGGLVVIDFIDMLNEENQNKVESAFRKAIYSDRARVQISSISRFGLLEISRQRLRPSLNESYDIEHVLVRGPRSLGISILRIVGEDAAKENTGEIHVYVPSDVASYLLNEKRYDIINIEKSNKIKVLVIADPYKSRPYYKVIRIKASDIKNTESYNLTPESPEPDINWRDANNKTKTMKPLVDGVKPPKMPKTKKAGLMKWLKSITGLEAEEVEQKKKPRRANKGINNNKRKKPSNRNKKFLNNSNKPKTNNKNKNKVNENPKKSVKPKNNVRKPELKKENQNKIKKQANVDETPTKTKEPAMKEIIKDKKPKKVIPTRAKNDPRQKS